MKLKNFLTFAMVGGVLFTSCNKDEFEGTPTIPGETELGYTTVYIEDAPKAYSISEGNSVAGTKEESQITQLEFYVFDKEGNRDEAAGGENAKGYINITGTDVAPAKKYSFVVTAGENKTVLVAANMNLGSQEGKKLAQVKEAMVNREIPEADRPGLPANSSSTIPMSGEAKVTVEPKEIAETSITVSRLYAKLSAPVKGSQFKVEITKQADVDSIKTLLGGTLSGELKMDITGYIVVNGLKNSYAFPNYGTTEDAQWDHSVWTLGNEITNYTKSSYDPTTNQIVKVYSGTSIMSVAEGAGVYVYENSPKRKVDNGLTTFDNGSVYAVIMEGQFYDSNNPATKVPRYWRINISKSEEKASYYRILRNSVYNIGINKVTTIGHGTPGEAEGENPIPDLGDAGILAEITVADWRSFKEETDL